MRMKKKLIVLISVFAAICCLNPVLSQGHGFETPHDTIRFIPGTTEYNLVLEGKEQFFVYDTIRPFTGISYYSTLWIKNNSKKAIVLRNVRTNSSGKMLVDLLKSGRDEEIKPGKSVGIVIRPNLRRPGILHAWASVFYKTADGAEKELQVQVRGYTLPVPQTIDPPVVTEAKEQKPVSTPINIKKPVKQPESREPVSVQPTYRSIPEGVISYDPGELILRQENQRDYSVTFHATPEESAYGFPPKPKKDLVFSWDTLDNSGVLSRVRFHLKNDSEYIVTILKIEGSNGSVFFKNTTDQKLVLPDSSFIVEFIPNVLNGGYFYNTLKVHYQSVYGLKQFEIKQRGYIPAVVAEAVSTADSLALMEFRNTHYQQHDEQKTGPFRLYVISDGKSNYKNARLELFSKQRRAIIQSETDQQGNQFFQVYRNGWDTLLIQVLSPTSEVLQKMQLSGHFEYDAYSIPFFPAPAPYTYHYRKVPYKKLDGIYWLEQSSDHFHSPDPTIIKKYTANTHIRFLENGTVEIKSLEEAIALEKKLFQSPLKIRLLPVSELNSGGGITWYSNTFTIEFFDDVSDEQIKNIFARYHITNYRKYSYNGVNNWEFSLEYILNRNYVKLLDQLWQLKEVSELIQEKQQIHGLD